MFSSSNGFSTADSSHPMFNIPQKVSKETRTPFPVEATMPQVVLPAQPPATYAACHEPHTTPNVLDEFFAGEAPQVQRTPSCTRMSMPPPYAPYGHEVVEVERGVYSVKEPVTLARMLFFYGFLFFPFWLAGIYILFSPLLPTTDWEAGKTEDEKKYLLQVLRETEKKWARRCLFAMIGLIITTILLTVIIKFGILNTI